MTICSSSPRSLLLAGAFIGAFTLWRRRAAAGQPAGCGGAAAAAPLPPGSPLIGRPGQRSRGEARAGRAAAACRPRADKLPIAKLKVPAGFNIEVYAAGMAERAFAGARRQGHGVRRQPPGRQGLCHRQQGRQARRSRCWPPASTGRTASPSTNGTLYIAELSKISKIDKVEDNLDNPPKPTMIYDNLPKDEAHGWKFIAIGPDNKLYIPVGQPGNNVLHDERARPDPADQSRRHRAPKWSRSASATPSASTGIRKPSSSTSPTTAATGCRRTCRRTNSIASPRSARISARPIATRAIFRIPNSAGAIPAANSPRRSA